MEDRDNLRSLSCVLKEIIEKWETQNNQTIVKLVMERVDSSSNAVKIELHTKSMQRISVLKFLYEGDS